MSWINPSHNGYPYPEAAAWLLDLMARRAPGSELLQNQIVAGLRRDLLPSGGCGRGEIAYVFDTAVALEALLAHMANGCALPSRELPDILFRFLEDRISQRQAMDTPLDSTGPVDGPWSRIYGRHLLRALPALLRYAEWSGDRRAEKLADQLIGDLAELPFASGDSVYTHALCYATEGLLELECCRALVRQAADFLSEIQTEEGGIPAWHNGARGTGGCRGDSTAQAVRIWATIDLPAYSRCIERGLTFLAALQRCDGGLAYGTASGDINTWVTIFAIDAVELVRERQELIENDVGDAVLVEP